MISRRLHRSANTRLIWLRDKVINLTPATSFSHDESIAFVVIETVNVWASFTRAYYLSWFMKPRTLTGQRVSCTQPLRSFSGRPSLVCVTHARLGISVLPECGEMSLPGMILVISFHSPVRSDRLISNKFLQFCRLAQRTRPIYRQFVISMLTGTTRLS